MLVVLCCGCHSGHVVEDASVALNGTHACKSSQPAAVVRGLSIRTCLSLGEAVGYDLVNVTITRMKKQWFVLDVAKPEEKKA